MGVSCLISRLGPLDRHFDWVVLYLKSRADGNRNVQEALESREPQVSWDPSYVLAMIRLQDGWLFWPYSFSISPSILKTDGSHLEGRKLSVMLQALTIFSFKVLIQLYRLSFITHKHPSDGGVVAPATDAKNCLFLIIPQFFDHLPPLLVIGLRGRVLGEAFLPPSYIFFGSAGNGMSTRDR